MQSLVRSFTHTRSVHCGGITHTLRSRAPADWPQNTQSHQGSGSVYSNVASHRIAAASTAQHGPPSLEKHFEFTFTQFMGLQAEDSSPTRAYRSVSGDRLPADRAMLAGRLQNGIFRSIFTYWQQMRPCVDYAGRRDHVGVHTFSRISQGYSSLCAFLDYAGRRNHVGVHTCSQVSRGYSSVCDSSIVPCDSIEFSHLQNKKKSGEDEGYADASDDAHNSVYNSAVTNRLLTIDGLTDMLLSAVTDPDSVDMQQVQWQLRVRYRRTPPEFFISDLRKKVEILNLQSQENPILKGLVMKRSFLFASPEDVQALFEVLKDFFVSGEKACSILARSSFVIAKPVECLREMLNLVVEFRIEKQAVEKSSGFLTCDASKVRDVFTYLRSWGVNDTCLSRMVSRDWLFMRWWDKEQIQAALGFLQSIGMSKAEILGILWKRPDVLCRPVDKNLMAKHKLCKQWGLNFSRVIHYITFQSNERILSQIQFFKEQGFADEAISKLVEREPRVLAKSREDLKLKLDYLLHTHKRDIAEIVSFPASVCYSYKYRIVPRLTFLKEKGLLDSLRLAYVLAITGSRFRTAFKVPESVKLT